eukprot:TRINITY_DN28397_c0_g1_i2.p1 TRINITY_DN28397_c0_g1~~TRINITY_DN28397_c0_g1_i2.p1  ORF type:complete len:633 (+),score=97.33 TRINITY_DN28397_c0_g1_i2:71-1900(+)
MAAADASSFWADVTGRLDLSDDQLLYLLFGVVLFFTVLCGYITLVVFITFGIRARRAHRRRSAAKRASAAAEAADASSSAEALGGMSTTSRRSLLRRNSGRLSSDCRYACWAAVAWPCWLIQGCCRLLGRVCCCCCKSQEVETEVEEAAPEEEPKKEAPRLLWQVVEKLDALRALQQVCQGFDDRDLEAASSLRMAATESNDAAEEPITELPYFAEIQRPRAPKKRTGEPSAGGLSPFTVPPTPPPSVAQTPDVAVGTPTKIIVGGGPSIWSEITYVGTDGSASRRGPSTSSLRSSSAGPALGSPASPGAAASVGRSPSVEATTRRRLFSEPSTDDGLSTPAKSTPASKGSLLPPVPDLQTAGALEQQPLKPWGESPSRSIMETPARAGRSWGVAQPSPAARPGSRGARSHSPAHTLGLRPLAKPLGMMPDSPARQQELDDWAATPPPPPLTRRWDSLPQQPVSPEVLERARQQLERLRNSPSTAGSPPSPPSPSTRSTSVPSDRAGSNKGDALPLWTARCAAERAVRRREASPAQLNGVSRSSASSPAPWTRITRGSQSSSPSATGEQWRRALAVDPAVMQVLYQAVEGDSAAVPTGGSPSRPVSEAA